MYNIYTMEYYSVIIKNEIVQSVTKQMGLEGIMLSEISQKEKDKYCMTSLSVIISKAIHIAANVIISSFSMAG